MPTLVDTSIRTGSANAEHTYAIQIIIAGETRGVWVVLLHHGDGAFPSKAAEGGYRLTLEDLAFLMSFRFFAKPQAAVYCKCTASSSCCAVKAKTRAAHDWGRNTRGSARERDGHPCVQRSFHQALCEVTIVTIGWNMMKNVF